MEYNNHYWNIDSNKIIEDLTIEDSCIIMDTLMFINRAMEENRSFLATIWFHAPHFPCIAGFKHATIYEDTA